MDKTHVPYPGCYCADCVENPSASQPVGWICAEMLKRTREFEANGIVMFDRPCGTARMPVYAEPPSARITGDKDRSVQSRAPTETNRQLAIECHRLRSVLRWIADTGYVDQQSGNQNFEHLQSIARDALSKEPSHG